MLRVAKRSTADVRTIDKISQNDVFANMSLRELEEVIEQFLRPVTDGLPDKQLSLAVRLVVQDVITLMGRGLAHTSNTIWQLPSAFIATLPFHVLVMTVYCTTCILKLVSSSLDPVNFEKPYNAGTRRSFDGAEMHTVGFAGEETGSHLSIRQVASTAHCEKDRKQSESCS